MILVSNLSNSIDSISKKLNIKRVLKRVTIHFCINQLNSHALKPGFSLYFMVFSNSSDSFLGA